MSLNKVILIGYAGKDPEVRYLREKTFSKVARFSLATTDRRKDSSGKILEYTEWHNIAVWNASADYAEANVKKGMMLYVEGKLHYSSWTDTKGNSTTTCEIFATNIQVLQKAAAPDEKYQTEIKTDYEIKASSGIKEKESKVTIPETLESAGNDRLPF